MTFSQHKILIVDDDHEIMWYLGKLMEKFGYSYEVASCGNEAIIATEKNNFDVIILDINMPDISGVEVMKKLKEKNVSTVVIILSAYENVSYAVETTKLGAYDYLVKPIDEEKLRITLQNAIKTKELESEVYELRKKIRGEEDGEIYTQYPEFQKLIDTIKKIAAYDVSILILGESGTGKELVARTIHKNSKRKDGPFISIDCATLPDNLVESELFGYEKGAFTGAIDSKSGRFELANGGTLFLDEIGNLSLNVQKKLLRVLQERKIMRLGGKKVIDLDIRIIAATNVNLKEAVKKGEFREDLYHRLNEFYVELPPLRERTGDIELLIGHFISKFNAKFGKNVKAVDEEVKNILLNYNWPGNVRELENVIKHAVIIAEDSITKTCLPKNLFTSSTDEINDKFSINGIMPLKVACNKVVEQVEKEMILRALKEYKYNKTKVAEVLQIDYKTLYNKIKEYGI